MTGSHEIAAMRRAIALSALGLGTTSPNPPVGCVILDVTGRSVGEGYHQRKGEPHAEVHALKAAGDLARGGTAAVTLEPCNHYGRTPPCHQALIDAGIARVLIAVIDPTSRGAGGAARLRDAGVDVEVGILADEALTVLQPWLTTLETRRPQVIWACDHTSGKPKRMADQLLVEAGLRANIDAVLLPDGRVEEGTPNTHGQSSFNLPAAVDPTDPEAALSALYAAGARTVLLHGGTDLADPFADRQLVDKVTAYVAAKSASARADANAALTPDFRIDAVRRLSRGVLVEAIQIT